MPPSRGKGKTRARRGPATDAHEPSDAETPEAITTPSRSSRKRPRGSDAVVAPSSRNTRRKTKDTRAVEREDTEGTEGQEYSGAETEPSLPSEQEIIQHLRVSDKPVNATEDFANDLLEGQENVPGYGKIAGRDWAFIIRKVEVNIGRPEAQEKLTIDENGHAAVPSAKTVVDIDLGPDRQVSRSHAMITYDGDNARWFVIVNGRNGLRIDNNLLKRGAKSYLRNGSVIEINGTQMAFITTAAEGDDGPTWDASIIKQAQKSSEEDDDGEDDMQANGHRPDAPPAARNALADAKYPAADYNGSQQQTQQQQRPHPHSQRAMQALPGTPMRSQQSMMKSSPAANYARGVMMESTESIDYSADSAKDLKPPHSYAQLIGMAILSTQEQQMTLNNIYKWIMNNYAFYRFNTGGWQNSIRHNLSLNKAFTKIARRTDEPGKGMKWMIEPSEFDTFVQQGMKGCRRPNPLPASTSIAGSPTSPMHVPRPGPNGAKREHEITPPLHAYRPAYPTATEAFTPDRGPKRQASRGDSSVGLGPEGDSAEYDYLTRSTPRHGMNAIANGAGSPPALYVNEDTRIGPLDTPFPLKPSMRLAPPSTLKRPSDFIQFSSPAPFWKMEGLVGSTPWKQYDLSPIKTPLSSFKKEGTVEDSKKPVGAELDDGTKMEASSKESDSADGKGSPVVPSSSPPRLGSVSQPLDASPSMSRPSTGVAKTLSHLVQSREWSAEGQRSESNERSHSRPPTQGQTEDTTSQASMPPSATTTSFPPPAGRQSYGPESNVLPPMESYRQPSQPLPVNPAYANQGVPAPAANGYPAAAPAGDAEDEGIDLAKGFQPIGAFHQRNHLAMGMGMRVAGAQAFGR